MSSTRKTLAFVLSCAWLSGCGNPREPAGPDNMLIFELIAQPQQISGQQNAQLYLTPVLLEDCRALHGEMVLLSSSSEFGFFTYDTSRVDTNAVSWLNPDVWYSHLNPAGATKDTIYAYCVDVYNNTLAWDSCTVEVMGSP